MGPFRVISGNSMQFQAISGNSRLSWAAKTQESVLSIWKDRLCAMAVKDGMNKLGRRVPLELC